MGALLSLYPQYTIIYSPSNSIVLSPGQDAVPDLGVSKVGSWPGPPQHGTNWRLSADQPQSGRLASTGASSTNNLVCFWGG